MRAGWQRRGLALARRGAVAAALLVGAAAAAAEIPPGTITVEGEAEAEVVPDTARLSLGVEADRASAAEATAEVARAAQAIMAGFAAAGIAAPDITTTAVMLSRLDPDERLRRPGGPALPRTFRAATTFEVTVRPAERAGLIAAEAVDHGGTSIGDIGYASSREAALRDGLRADAVRDARRKATLYAEALGLHLGPVLEITPREEGLRPPGFAVRAALVSKATVPTAPGTLSLQTGVAVRWALAP